MEGNMTMLQQHKCPVLKKSVGCFFFLFVFFIIIIIYFWMLTDLFHI